MTVANDVVERAIALASGTAGSPVEELTASGRPALEEARSVLVQRIYARSDDYDATGALGLVNKALAALGWEDAYNWKHRRKP